MDIRDKLRLLESLPRNKRVVNHRVSTEPNTALFSQPSGDTVETPVGSFSRFEKTYALDFRQGTIPLASFLETPPEVLALVSNTPELSKIDIKKTLFVDSETTGLSGGAGTCAFLIGAGYFTDTGFCLHQYFMNDFNEEAALFHELNQLVQRFESIVSYNGKSYDIPLLNSRNIYLGTRSPFPDILHLDLLHAVRKLWSHRLPNCSLQTAEAAVLGVSRHGDIPGHLIPGKYFDYLRRRDFATMKPVLYHNQQDILSMVALSIQVSRVVQSPRQMCHDSLDALKVGRIFEQCERYRESNELYEHVLAQSPDGVSRRDLLFRLALNHKRMNNWHEAARVWHRCLDRERYHPLPYIELAKHYEHRVRNYLQAKTLVAKALTELEVLETIRKLQHWTVYKADLEYRLRRLVGKLDGKPCGARASAEN